MNSTSTISLSSNTIDTEDFTALIDWLKGEPKLSKGEITVEFEKEWAKKMQKKYAVFVNSGSSANLILLYSLICTGELKNSKIAVPAVSWSTTVAPIIQFGLTPILVDCNFDNLSVDIQHLTKIFKEEAPAALFLVSVLGLVPDMAEIQMLCKKYNVVLILDNCEGLGSTYAQRPLEAFALASTTSLFYSHQLCTIEGGMIVTDDFVLYNTLLMLRSHGWLRDVDREFASTFQVKWDYNDFESLYKFYHPGFNVRSTDLQAFIGLRQLGKMDSYINKRNYLYRLYSLHLSQLLWKPAHNPHAFVSCLGYPVISPRRSEIVNALIKNGIECRPLIAGSMATQPFFSERYGIQLHVNNSLKVDAEGFYVPCHTHLTDTDVELITGIINSFT